MCAHKGERVVGGLVTLTNSWILSRGGTNSECGLISGEQGRGVEGGREGRCGQNSLH